MIAALVAIAAVATSEISGKVEMQPPPGRASEPAGTVVWLPGAHIEGAEPGNAAVVSQGKRFEPRVLAVPKGTMVSFPNLDPVYHNAFSLTPGDTFDLGLYRRGVSRATRFDTPGVVRVYCNIHPEMAAYVVVVEGNAYTVVGSDGRFRIAGLPPGRHTVSVWNEMTGEQSAAVDLPPGRVLTWDVTLDATHYERPLLHKNKHGREYPPATRDDDRY
jgi:plastocyanin